MEPKEARSANGLTGTYVVEEGLLTVTTPDGRTRTANAGPPEGWNSLAGLLLRELGPAK